MGHLPWEGKREDVMFEEEKVRFDPEVERLYPYQELFDQEPFRQFVADTVGELGGQLEATIDERSNLGIPVSVLSEESGERAQALTTYLLYSAARDIYPRPVSIYKDSRTSPFFWVAKYIYMGECAAGFHIPTREDMELLYHKNFRRSRFRGFSSSVSEALGDDTSDAFWRFYFGHEFSEDTLWFAYLGDLYNGVKGPVYTMTGRISTDYQEKVQGKYPHFCAQIYYPWRGKLIHQLTEILSQEDRGSVTMAEIDRLSGLQELLPHSYESTDELLRLESEDQISPGKRSSHRDIVRTSIVKHNR